MTSSLNPFPHPLNGGDIAFIQPVFEYILSTARGWEYKDKQVENRRLVVYWGKGETCKLHLKDQNNNMRSEQNVP